MCTKSTLQSVQATEVNGPGVCSKWAIPVNYFFHDGEAINNTWITLSENSSLIKVCVNVYRVIYQLIFKINAIKM